MQTNYQDQSVANISVKGGLADLGITNKVTRASAAVIPFGLGLALLSTGLVAIPSAGSFEFAGIAVMKHKAQSNADGFAQYEIGEAISVIRKGRIWVYSEVAVDPTADVYLRYTANTGPTRIPGDFLKTADSSKAQQITNARWVSTTSAAGLAILEINIP